MVFARRRVSRSAAVRVLYMPRRAGTSRLPTVARSRIGTLALTLGVHVQVLTSTVTSNGLPSAHNPGTRARFRRITKEK